MALTTTAPEPRLERRIVTLAEVCDAAVVLLHSVSLSLPFISNRRWLHESQFEDMGEPVVDVCPGPAYIIERDSRQSWRRMPTVSILVRQRIDEEQIDERLDQLMGFVEEIRDAFAYNPLPLETCGTIVKPMAQSIACEPLIVYEHLETMRQFTSGLTIAYTLTD